MNLAIIFAAVTVIATTLGGYIALRASDRFHLVLGLSAGLLLGLVGFDLLPEVFEMNKSSWLGVPAVSVAILAGFLTLHIVEGFFGSHEPAESDYGHDHEHHNIAGSLGALAMGGYPGAPTLDGGFTVLELPSREEAITWAARLATACRCQQELRVFGSGPQS